MPQLFEVVQCTWTRVAEWKVGFLEVGFGRPHGHEHGPGWQGPVPGRVQVEPADYSHERRRL